MLNIIQKFTAHTLFTRYRCTTLCALFVTRITRSFLNVNELEEYLFEEFNFSSPDDAAKYLWDLDVGSSETFFISAEVGNVVFSIQSKQRIGSQLHDGSIIGKNN